MGCFSEFMRELMRSLFHDMSVMCLHVAIETVDNDNWNRRAKITIACDKLEDNERRHVEEIVLQMRENYRFEVFDSVTFANQSVVIMCKCE